MGCQAPATPFPASSGTLLSRMLQQTNSHTPSLQQILHTRTLLVDSHTSQVKMQTFFADSACLYLLLEGDHTSGAVSHSHKRALNLPKPPRHSPVPHSQLHPPIHFLFPTNSFRLQQLQPLPAVSLINSSSPFPTLSQSHPRSCLPSSPPPPLPACPRPAPPRAPLFPPNPLALLPQDLWACEWASPSAPPPPPPALPLP